MRAIVIALAAVGWFASTMSAADGLDVRGRVRANGRPQPNAVVWLEAPNAPASPPAAKVVLDQRNLNFYPPVLAVRVVTTVVFPNNDRVFHNVFSFRDGKRFDLGMYPVGTVRRVTFDKPGLSRLFCNIHPTMAAYVMAVDTPTSASPTNRAPSSSTRCRQRRTRTARGVPEAKSRPACSAWIATSGSRSRTHEDGRGSHRRSGSVRLFESGAWPTDYC